MWEALHHSGTTMNQFCAQSRVDELVSSEPERVLWERVVAGRVGADAEVVRRHQACVVRFVARMLGASDPAVDDIVQQTFITALADPERYGGRASLRSWLLGIAHNKTRMLLRSRARRRRMAELWGRVQALYSRAAPPCAEARQAGVRIQQALATLDANHRAVFLLTEVEGFTAAEAAAVVGAPPGTVRRWRVEAKQRLQPLLADLRPNREAL